MGPELEYAALCADCWSLYGLYYMQQHPCFVRVLISKQTDEQMQTVGPELDTSSSSVTPARTVAPRPRSIVVTANALGLL
jgi:hypothetical protein